MNAVRRKFWGWGLEGEGLAPDELQQLGALFTERLGIDVDLAFTLLRDQARGRTQRLSDLARAFVDGTQIIAGPEPRP